MAASVAVEPEYQAADLNRNQPVVASLRDVTKKFGNHIALDRLTLELRRGEVVALLGPNGAGKTTAVRLLLGLSRATSGEVNLFGGDPQDRRNRMRLGAMLQVGRIPEKMQVREHLELFRSYYPQPRPLADLLSVAGLQGLERRLFGELSGGQKQRVLFAIALCGDPDLICLDEPTLGLDVEARRSMWEQVRRLSAMGKTILLTTHYLEEADSLASRIVVVQKGRVIAEGTPQELKAANGLRTIRCRTALLPAHILTMPGVSSAERQGQYMVVGTMEPEVVLRSMLAQDVTLSALEVRTVALEDAFLALTNDSKH